MNHPIGTIQPKWLGGCRFMESLGLLVPNYKRFSHSLLWGNFGVPKLIVHRFTWLIGFELFNRYLDRQASSGLEEKLLKENWEIVISVKIPWGPMSILDPKMTHIEQFNQNKLRNMGVMGSLELFGPNYKELDWSVLFLQPWEHWKFSHSLLWGKCWGPKISGSHDVQWNGFVLVNRYFNQHT